MTARLQALITAAGALIAVIAHAAALLAADTNTESLLELLLVPGVGAALTFGALRIALTTGGKS